MLKNSMYSKLSLFFLLAVLVMGSAFTSSVQPLSEEGISTVARWEKLGQRKVNYGLDRDEILVTAREGFFTALKLKVKNGGINFHRCVVHFRNGQTQTVNIKQTIRPGQETRVLDLSGKHRIITKVVFWYDTKNFARRRGTVELWGRH